FSQIDAAFPMSLPEGASLGVEYVLRTIRWAYLAGCDHVDTTDDRFAPKGLTNEQALDMMKRSYSQIIEVAERYKMIIDIEPHGYYTTKPEFMEKMLSFVDSDYLRMNMDTGNTFIAGQDPVAFLQKFKNKVSHVHVKDVSDSLASSLRGELTGIAVSQCAIGDGVNGENIKKCFDILADNKFDGVVSLECEGQGGPMIEKSLAWVRKVVDDANKRMAS
ncbi:MAG: sugar phosphate isomerase/epimerase family protein, partial [Anaerolineaceae bacterium]|nr:sugar phosphate isomerase/epimerase family protein [Anaerolineaceae bacterium]